MKASPDNDEGRAADARLFFAPEFRAGVGDTGGLAVGGAVFGVLFGIVALGRGLTEWQALLMSATAFAGAAQVAVMEIWQDPLPYLPIAITAALVCNRHVLMGMTLYDVLVRDRRRPPLAGLLLLTDANWVLTMRDKQAPNRLAYFTGSGIAMYAGWMCGSAIGVALPGLLDAVTITGLRLGGALYIAILLCIFFRGRSRMRMVAPAIAAAVAVGASRWLDHSAALMTGVAAAAVVTLIRELRRRG